MYSVRSALLATAFLLLPVSAQAQDAANDYVLTLKDHAFSPKELTIPANTKIKLVIKNLDTTPAEFESYTLNREKIIGGNSEASVFIGPLPAGTYEYFDEFHEDTTKGTIIVK